MTSGPYISLPCGMDMKTIGGGQARCHSQHPPRCRAVNVPTPWRGEHTLCPNVPADAIVRPCRAQPTCPARSLYFCSAYVLLLPPRIIRNGAEFSYLPPPLCPLLPPRSYRTTLCLQYPAEKIALAAIWVNNEMNKAQFGTGLENVSAYAKHINNGSGFILG